MVKRILILLVFVSNFTIAQKPQRIAYIDMEYILENVPEYTNAQSKLDAKVVVWKKKLDELKREIEILKTDLSNEKVLLTKDLIEEREEDIQIKELEFKKLEAAYFGPNGDMFLLRKQLVKPVQDQIFNAVQEIRKKGRYDFVFDKSSDLIMLYANKKYDISSRVIKSITKSKKQLELEEKRNKKSSASQKETHKATKEKSGEVSKKLNDKELRTLEKRKQRENRIKALEAKKLKRKKLLEAKRKEILDKKEAAKKAKEKDQ